MMIRAAQTATTRRLPIDAAAFDEGCVECVGQILLRAYRQRAEPAICRSVLRPHAIQTKYKCSLAVIRAFVNLSHSCQVRHSRLTTDRRLRMLTYSKAGIYDFKTGHCAAVVVAAPHPRWYWSKSQQASMIDCFVVCLFVRVYGHYLRIILFRVVKIKSNNL